MKKGFEVVAKWKEQSDERREAFAQGYTPFFMMQDGESVEGLWFNGCPDSEPLVVDIHTLSLGGNKFRSVVHDPKNCIACRQRRGGDRRVSAVQQRAVFSVADPRWIHKVKDPEKSTAEKEKFQYVPCANDDDGDGKCKLCAKGHKRERSGQKRWEMRCTSSTRSSRIAALAGERSETGSARSAMIRPPLGFSLCRLTWTGPERQRTRRISSRRSRQNLCLIGWSS